MDFFFIMKAQSHRSPFLPLDIWIGIWLIHWHFHSAIDYCQTVLIHWILEWDCLNSVHLLCNPLYIFFIFNLSLCLWIWCFSFFVEEEIDSDLTTSPLVNVSLLINIINTSLELKKIKVMNYRYRTALPFVMAETTLSKIQSTKMGPGIWSAQLLT